MVVALPRRGLIHLVVFLHLLLLLRLVPLQLMRTLMPVRLRLLRVLATT